MWGFSCTFFSFRGVFVILTGENARHNRNQDICSREIGVMGEDVYIGIDLGGTRVRAGRLTKNLEIEARTETDSLAEEGKDAVIGRIFAQAEAVWPKDGSRVLGVGVSAPGPVNPKTGVVVRP